MSIRTPNYGLFEGIANGVNQGLITYQNQKNIQHQRQMQGLMSGVETDEHGNPTGNFAPWKQQQIETQGLLGKAQVAQAQQQMRENDPNDPLAQSLNDVYKDVNPNKGGEFMPGASFNEKKAVGEGLEMKKLGAILANQGRQVLKPSDWQKMADDFDPTKARSGEYGKAQQLLNSTARIDAIFEQFPDLDSMPHPQKAELANAVAALYGGGSAQSQHQINTINPSTGWGDATAVLSYLDNLPHGAGQGAFLKVMKDSSDREKGVANKMLHDMAAAKMAKYPNYFDADPIRYSSIVQSRGISPEEIGPHGNYVPKQPAPMGLMASPPPAHVPAGRVTVKDPRGNIGHIPAAQLQDALKQGYVEVK